MKRLEVWLVNLDPTIGSEIKKMRPAVIVSPNELNEHLRTVVIVPLTTGKRFPFRLPTRVGGKPGVAAIDQLRAIDKQRLVKKVGRLQGTTATKVLAGLQEMFAP